MAWMESHQELARHPKTNKFARLAGITIPAAIGHLHLLWWWAMDYAQDGDLGKYDAGDIADAAMWQGEADCLVESLADAGFIDRTESGMAIHDWNDYAGKRLEQLAKDRERKKKAAGVPEPFRNASSGRPAEGSGKPRQKEPPKPAKQTDAKFKPPTVEEVAAYCRERNNGIDAEQFVAFYASKGWMVGSNKMKDWKQAVITWENRRKGVSTSADDKRDTPGLRLDKETRFHDALEGLDDDGNPI